MKTQILALTILFSTLVAPATVRADEPRGLVNAFRSGLYFHIQRIAGGAPVWLRFYQNIGTLVAGQPYVLNFDPNRSTFTVTGFSASTGGTRTATYPGYQLSTGELVVWGAKFQIDGGQYLYHPATGQIVGTYSFPN